MAIALVNFLYPYFFMLQWYKTFIYLTVLFYFLFQLIFLKKKILTAVVVSFTTLCIHYFLVLVFLHGEPIDRFLTVQTEMGGECTISYTLEYIERYVFLFCLSVVCQKLFGWGRKLTKRTDVYPISLFIPKEKTVQKALVKREQGKAYSALIAFISYVIVGVALFYAAALMGTFRYISLYEEYGKSYLFIPWAVLYLPLLYFVYKGYWFSAVGVYIFLLWDLFGKYWDYNLYKYEQVFFFVRGFIFIRAGMLLAVICKVERQKLKKKTEADLSE